MHKGVNTTMDEGQTMVAHSLRADGFDAGEDGTGRGTPLAPIACIAFSADVSDTVCANEQRTYTHEGTNNIRTRNVVAAGWAVRRLTPLECERLQGFPDGYTLVPYRGKPASDGPRYKALGNSMAVNCMRWLGRRIELVHSLSTDPVP